MVIGRLPVRRTSAVVTSAPPGLAAALTDASSALAGSVPPCWFGIGSLYIVTGLARRIVTAGWRWSANRPGRRLLAAAIGLALLTALTAFWTMKGQFRGW